MPQQNTFKTRIVVAMSGGVDSSVAAALLVEQGYDVVGMMMRLWSEPGIGSNAPVNRCCTPDQIADARRVADHLKIPFYVLDAQDIFRRQIVDYFISAHEAGQTPNPCIRCNRQIRFTYLLQQALALNASYMATGHYAKIEATNGRFRLLKSQDDNKDQSYALYALNQEQLSHALFPIGSYTKPEVRGLAARFSLPVAAKQESQDLCFLGDGDYRRFLKEHSDRVANDGPIRDMEGHKIGQHEGLAFYTIGQRKGLGITSSEPLFVIQKDIIQNTLVVGPRRSLGKTEMAVLNVNWISGKPLTKQIHVEVKIRYKSAALGATLTPTGEGCVMVTFDEPVQGISPGQSAVFYDHNHCLGGGVINE